MFSVPACVHVCVLVNRCESVFAGALWVCVLVQMYMCQNVWVHLGSGPAVFLVTIAAHVWARLCGCRYLFADILADSTEHDSVLLCVS